MARLLQIFWKPENVEVPDRIQKNFGKRELHTNRVRNNFQGEILGGTTDTIRSTQLFPTFHGALPPPYQRPGFRGPAFWEPKNVSQQSQTATDGVELPYVPIDTSRCIGKQRESFGQRAKSDRRQRAGLPDIPSNCKELAKVSLRHRAATPQSWSNLQIERAHCGRFLRITSILLQQFGLDGDCSLGR